MADLPRLEELCLQLTNACPLRCVHCSTRAGPPSSGEMTDHDVLRLISDFAELGGRVIEFSGGEPLVHPRLEEFVAVAKTSGLEVRIYSSGVIGIQGRSAIPPHADRWGVLRQAGLSKVYFNLQAETAPLHDRITRIPGSFEAVLSSLKAAKRSGLYVGVHFVPMAPNFRHLQETHRLSKELKVDEFAILRLVLQGRADDNRDSLSLTQTEFLELLGGAMRLQKESREIRVRLGCPLNHRLLLDAGSEGAACRAGEGVCHVRPNGDIVPCSGLQHGGITLGNVRSTRLTDAWSRGAAWSSFRQARSTGPALGSIEFIRMTGDPCLAQLPGLPSVGSSRLTMTREGLQTDSGIQVAPEGERR